MLYKKIISYFHLPLWQSCICNNVTVKLRRQGSGFHAASELSCVTSCPMKRSQRRELRWPVILRPLTVALQLITQVCNIYSAQWNPFYLLFSISFLEGGFYFKGLILNLNNQTEFLNIMEITVHTMHFLYYAITRE